MSSVWVRVRIGRSPYTVVAALVLMTDPLVEAALAELLWDCQWSSRVKSGGAGGITDRRSEYIVDVRLGERALCAEDPREGLGDGARFFDRRVFLAAPLGASCPQT